MKADILISKLQQVRKTGKDSWIACCPAHADKSPSMTIRALPDDTTLIHCFSGCDTGQILDSIGMSFDDLFPDRPKDFSRGFRRPFPAGDVLEALNNETLLVYVAACNVRRGVPLSESDMYRLAIAADRIEQARELANGR